MNPTSNLRFSARSAVATTAAILALSIASIGHSHHSFSADGSTAAPVPAPTSPVNSPDKGVFGWD